MWSHDITNKMADIRGPRLFTDLNNAFRRDPNIDEFDVLAIVEPKHNRSPFILQNHKLGVEAWAVKILLKYTANLLIGWRRRTPEEKLINPIEVCQLTRAVLLFNPDNYTAWNARKELIETGYLTISEDLTFGALVLTKHPKSPETFIHRRWIFQQLLHHCLSSSSGSNASCSGAGAASNVNEDSTVSMDGIDFDVSSSPDPSSAMNGAFSLEASRLLISQTQNELSVCESAAARYPSNYHAWSHRIWIVQHCLNCSIQALLSELNTTEDWTRKHISDHSGFHFRQFLLSQLLAKKDRDNSPLNSEDLLEKEMTFVTGLIHSYPGHEALWYHRRFVFQALLQNDCIVNKAASDCAEEMDGTVDMKKKKLFYVANELKIVQSRSNSPKLKYEQRLSKNYIAWMESLEGAV